MKIKKQCSLVSTTSKNKYVQSIVGKCGELNLETGQYMVFHIPIKDGRVLQMKTGPMKTIGAGGIEQLILPERNFDSGSFSKKRRNQNHTK